MKRVITPNSVFGIVVGTLLPSLKVAIVIAAVAWAIAHWLQVGPTGLIVLSAIAAVPCLMALATFARMAYDAETDPENQ